MAALATRRRKAAEVDKLRAENAALKAEVARLTPKPTKAARGTDGER